MTGCKTQPQLCVAVVYQDDSFVIVGQLSHATPDVREIRGKADRVLQKGAGNLLAYRSASLVPRKNFMSLWGWTFTGRGLNAVLTKHINTIRFRMIGCRVGQWVRN